MQSDLFELRSVVYAEKTKFKSKQPGGPVIDLTVLSADLANKADRSELKNEIAMQVEISTPIENENSYYGHHLPSSLP